MAQLKDKSTRRTLVIWLQVALSMKLRKACMKRSVKVKMSRVWREKRARKAKIPKSEEHQ